MKLYIAAPFATRIATRKMAERIRAIGIEVTSRWLDEDESLPYTDERQSQCAADDIEDIRSADEFLLVSSTPSSTGGKHFETGYAWAIGKPVTIWGPRENVFHYMRGLMVIPHDKDIIEHLKTRLAIQ